MSKSSRIWARYGSAFSARSISGIADEFNRITLRTAHRGYAAALKQKSRKVVVLALRQLLRLVQEYPRGPLLAAVEQAAHYGLYDLDRLERMILHRVARDYFLLKVRIPDDGDRHS